MRYAATHRARTDRKAKTLTLADCLWGPVTLWHPQLPWFRRGRAIDIDTTLLAGAFGAAAQAAMIKLPAAADIFGRHPVRRH
jgi:hypothetical protein